ncbi:MAG TPA: hypothetical protein VFS67_13680 [Polyangiaceae bacterium]|nr:hypothetical protein [Polyangiaceae bacterium]
MRKASVIATVCRGAVFAAALGTSMLGCRKDEPPPPLPEAPKPAEPAAVAPLELKPEDAGKPPEPAAAPPAKATARKASGGLAACCAALRQNAANAPEPTKGYMLTAAGVCDGAAQSGVDKDGTLKTIRAMLKGAGVPTDCK